MQKVVLATGNAGKVRELASLLSDFGLDVVAQTELGVDSAEETGLTFIENAILKARHAAKMTGLPAIADDSGLAVDVLGGARVSIPRAILAKTRQISKIWKNCCILYEMFRTTNARRDSIVCWFTCVMPKIPHR